MDPFLLRTDPDPLFYGLIVPKDGKDPFFLRTDPEPLFHRTYPDPFLHRMDALFYRTGSDSFLHRMDLDLFFLRTDQTVFDPKHCFYFLTCFHIFILYRLMLRIYNTLHMI